jgi:protease IV
MPEPTHPQRPESPTPRPPEPRYAAYPVSPRPTFFSTLLRLGGSLLLALLLVGVGFYMAIASFQMRDVVLPTVYRPGMGDRIAIIPIEGIIAGRTAEFVRLAVESVLGDRSIRAVVLRIESPGGGASASDQILHELGRLKRERGLPVIASYGGYAASGGYYVSCQADRIIAEPTTVTGSIGVIAQVPTVQELLRDKLGVKMETITASTSPQKDLANTYYRDWTEADRAVMLKLVDAVHERFVEVVYAGRKELLTFDEVAQRAGGQVFTAQEALEARLVDEIGYLDAALDAATTAGGFTEDKPPVVIYRPRMGVFDLLGYASMARPSEGTWPITDVQSLRQSFDELVIPRIELIFHP